MCPAGGYSSEEKGELVRLTLCSREARVRDPFDLQTDIPRSLPIHARFRERGFSSGDGLSVPEPAFGLALLGGNSGVSPVYCDITCDSENCPGTTPALMGFSQILAPTRFSQVLINHAVAELAVTGPGCHSQLLYIDPLTSHLHGGQCLR